MRTFACVLVSALCFVAGQVMGAESVTVTAGASKENQVELRYTLPADGFVTLAIDNAQGQRVRNLIGAAPRKAGANVELWDGTDDAGKAVSAGEYHWKMLRHAGVDIEYILSYGSPGTPPWATADGTGGWGADHTLPQAALATGDSVVLGWPMAESGWFLIGVGPDGHKEWGLKNRFAFGDTIINLATDGKYLYVASEQNPAPLMKYYKKLAHAVLYRYTLADHRLAKFGDQDEIVITDEMNGNVQGLALAGQMAYVSLAKDNRIVAISLKDGKLLPEQDITLTGPHALAMDKSGGLLAISGTQIQRVDLKTKQASVLIGQGLDQPRALCVDKSGAIYVSDQGKAQQVKVFDAAGKAVRTIGQAGGRSPRGAHNPQGMYRPRGLTVDAKGMLWVMEEDDRPQRASVWNATTGAFVREYIGAPHYGAMDGCVPEFDKNIAFGEGVQYGLDWTNKTYSYQATVGREASDQDVFGRTVIRKAFKKDGRVLTASNQHVQVICELKDNVLHPLAAVGEIDELTRRLGMHAGAITRKIEQLKAAGAKVDGRGFPTAAFIWVDQNGDGIAQDSEFTWKEGLRWGSYWGSGIGPDFAIYMQSGNKVYRLPATAWNSAGAPVYTFDSATTFNFTGSGEHIATSPDNVLIVNAKPALQGIDVASGKTAWTYPNIWEGVQGSHTADVPAPGRLIGPLTITGFADCGGEIGTLFGMNGNLAQQFIMTSDGMWVGAVMRDWRLARREDMYTVPDEDFGGYFWRDQASGQVYMEAGKSEYRLFRVTGLESIKRSDGTLAVEPAIAEAAAARVAAKVAPRQNIPQVAVAKLTSPLPISGKLAEMPAGMHFTEVAADANSKFRFALGHDQENLYLVCDVTDDSPFQNNGQNTKQMFTTGDCVDLMVGTNATANPRRQQGVAGDQRLLLTVRDGKPLAMLYKQVDPTRVWPVAFVSPSRAIYFGNVIELQDVKTAVTRSKTGYVLTASVPLATLGIKPDAMLSGDVGVVFGSESGNGARLRLYWANKATAITSDIPSEAALMPENWGQLKME